MRNFNINSTAISTLSMDGEQVNVQFTSSDKQYTFRAADPSTFVADLEQVIADPEGSVGSYINRARKSDLLVEVWLVTHRGLVFSWDPYYTNWTLFKSLCDAIWRMDTKRNRRMVELWT